MQPEKVFKRYDIRGKYPEKLDEEFAERIGRSLAVFMDENNREKVVVCRDNKKSSEALKKRLLNGLTSSGVEVVDTGIGPTDYAAFCCQREGVPGVQVTSSHMPLEFNGFKLLYPEGNGFVNRDLNRLKEIFKEAEFREGSGEVGEKKRTEEYRKAVAEFVREKGESFDGEIVVDTLGGSTAGILPEVLERLGFKVFDLGKYRQGVYRDPPNPKPDQLEELRSAVEQRNSYLGVATDLDGDRVKLFFDGEWISGDNIFCVFAQLFPGKAVASVDTSRKLEEFVDVDYTRVGDPFVADKMLEVDAGLSGEPNGHYCFPDLVNYNSGTVAAALSASLDLEKRLGEVPERFYRRRNLEYPDMNERDKAVQRAEDRKDRVDVVSEVDGVKFSFQGASVLVRPSGSSPKIRVKSEAESIESAEKGLDKALELLGKE